MQRHLFVSQCSTVLSQWLILQWPHAILLRSALPKPTHYSTIVQLNNKIILLLLSQILQINMLYQAVNSSTSTVKAFIERKIETSCTIPIVQVNNALFKDWALLFPLSEQSLKLPENAITMKTAKNNNPFLWQFQCHHLYLFVLYWIFRLNYFWIKWSFCYPRQVPEHNSCKHNHCKTNGWQKDSQKLSKDWNDDDYDDNHSYCYHYHQLNINIS